MRNSELSKEQRQNFVGTGLETGKNNSEFRIPNSALTFVGDYWGEDTPVPIPNTEVKLVIVDGTAREAGSGE